MARGVTRPSKLYGRDGRLGVSKTTFYENIVHHGDNDPFIPGTEVLRLKLARIGPKITIAFNDELDALEEALRRERDRLIEGLREASDVSKLDTGAGKRRRRRHEREHDEERAR